MHLSVCKLFLKILNSSWTEQDALKLSVAIGSSREIYNCLEARVLVPDWNMWTFLEKKFNNLKNINNMAAQFERT